MRVYNDFFIVLNITLIAIKVTGIKHESEVCLRIKSPPWERFDASRVGVFFGDNLNS